MPTELNHDVMPAFLQEHLSYILKGDLSKGHFRTTFVSELFKVGERESENLLKSENNAVACLVDFPPH